jgi:hypothetical protein
MAERKESRSVSALNRLILLAILIPVAIILVSYFLSPASPFKTQATPAPILIGQIQKQYKLETAEVTSSTTLEGKTSSFLPFSNDTYLYEMVVTMTAGIDLSTLKDSDITVSGETATVRLPAPQVLRIERSGHVLSQNSDILSGFSKNKNLLDQIQDEGQKRIVKTVLEQGKLMQDARLNAEENLRNFILQLGYKNVIFVQTEPNNTTPLPNPTTRPS